MADRRKILAAGALIAAAVAGSALVLSIKRPVAGPKAPVIPAAPGALARFSLILLSQVANTVDFQVRSLDMMDNLLPDIPYEIQINGVSQYASQTGSEGTGTFSLDLPSLAGFTIEVVAGSVVSNPISVFVS